VCPRPDVGGDSIPLTADRPPCGARSWAFSDGGETRVHTPAAGAALSAALRSPDLVLAALATSSGSGHERARVSFVVTAVSPRPSDPAVGRVGGPRAPLGVQSREMTGVPPARRQPACKRPESPRARSSSYWTARPGSKRACVPACNGFNAGDGTVNPDTPDAWATHSLSGHGMRSGLEDSVGLADRSFVVGQPCSSAALQRVRAECFCTTRWLTRHCPVWTASAEQVVAAPACRSGSAD